MDKLFRPTRLIRFFVLLWAFTVSSAVFAGDGAMQQVDPNEDPYPEIDIIQHLGDQVPMDLQFKDEHGNLVTLSECANGKPVILVMAYFRCPMLCTKVLNDLVESIKRIRPASIYKDYSIITISINPTESWVEASAIKRTYVGEYGRPDAEKGWHFLTGTKENIDKVCDSIGYKYMKDPRSKDYLHSSGITFLTTDGKISRYLIGIGYEASQVRLALLEASDGKIGTLADKLKLICAMDYDPSKKEYSLSVLRITKTMCALTLVLVGIYIPVSVLRKSNRRKIIHENDLIASDSSKDMASV